MVHHQGMTRQQLASAIVSVAHLTGTFRLRSGVESSEYFDKYRFESDPRLLRAICTALVPSVPPATEMLAGLELGGVPIATMLADLTGLPVVFVRKTAKSYGTCQLAEGAAIAGCRLLIVEDVVTSGGQVVLSAQDLRALGATVDHAICVIDREADGSRTLAAAGIALHALFGFGELRAAARLAEDTVHPLETHPAGASDESITIGRADLTADVSHALIDALNAELRELYPEPAATHFRLDPEEVADGRGAFFIVYREKTPVGCGALRRLDAGTAELKRMYISPAVRGKGLGRRLVAALEAEAQLLGVRRLVLETGRRQDAALALYRATGFRPIPLYGEYCLSPDTSICLGKSVGHDVDD
jgi:orotate phosphoribosyltransferase